MSDFDYSKLQTEIQRGFATLQQQIDPYRKLLQALQSSEALRAVAGGLSLVSAQLSETALGKELHAAHQVEKQLSKTLGKHLVGLQKTPQAAILEAALKGSVKILNESALGHMHRELRMWEQLAGSSHADGLAQHSVGWGVGISAVLAAAESANLAADVTAQMLRPTTLLAKLTQRTEGLLSEEPDPFRRARFEKSVEVVEAQVLDQISGLNHLRDHGVSADDEFVPNGPLRLATREQIEIVAAVGSDGGPALAAASPSVRTNILARRAVELISRINATSRLKGGDDVFKLTNRLFQAAVELAWTDAAGEQSFGTFIDQIYFMVYEGAGKDRLRYLREHGGPLDPTACEIVFCVKHLRNKWTRHDAEHGSEGDVRGSYAQLRKRLEQLGLKHFPRHAAEYRALQQRILEEIAGFLERLLGEITREAQ